MNDDVDDSMTMLYLIWSTPYPVDPSLDLTAVEGVAAQILMESNVYWQFQTITKTSTQTNNNQFLVGFSALIFSLLSVCVCMFANSSQTANPNELKFWGMTSLHVQMVLGYKASGFYQPFAEKKELKHEIELWNK